MTNIIIFAVWGIICGALGYWLAWNRAQHPGKVEGEASGLWAKIKAALHL